MKHRPSPITVLIATLVAALVAGLLIGPSAAPSRAAAAGAVLASSSTSGPESSSTPGPAFESSPEELGAAFTCYGDPATSRLAPILLVHGTGVNSEENWGSTYRPDLRRRGHAVCTVDLADYGFVDVQRSAERVAYGVRRVSELSQGRRLSIIGHSQGAFQAFLVVRVWPDLARRIDDVIGLAGVYDAGSRSPELSEQCRTGEGCFPAFQQLSSGSSLLQQLSRRSLPAGPSYTTIGTTADAIVTPQPEANRQPGAVSVQIQDVCAGRRSLVGADHVLMAGDAVAHALVIDALEHPGSASAARIGRTVCWQNFFDGVDLARFLQDLPEISTRQGEKTRRESALREYWGAW